MTYEQFIRTAQRSQRAYIRFERLRMRKAYAILDRTAAEFRKLGLHQLSGDEIAARLRQLDQMETEVPTTHGDTPVMRWAFEDRQKETA